MDNDLEQGTQKFGSGSETLQCELSYLVPTYI